MDSNDILEQPIVEVVEDINQPKVKKPRSKKDTSILQDEKKEQQAKKTKSKKQAVVSTSALEPASVPQEFDIVLEPSAQEINIDNTQEIDIGNSADNGNILESAQEIDIAAEPSPSEYKQISIKLPSQSQPRANKPKANKRAVVAEEGVEEVGLIEPIKPKRAYTKKQPKGDGDT